MRLVVIYIRHGKACLPIHARLASGIWFGIDPVYTSKIDLDELVLVTQKVLAAGHPHLSIESMEVQRQKDPILKAIGSRSWKELTRTGTAYSIGWSDKEIVLNISRVDRKGRWEYDPDKVHTFGIDTPLQDVLRVIVADIQSRPELWK